MKRLTVCIFVALMAIGLAPQSAAAHTGDQSYLYLDIGTELAARMQFPLVDVDEALGIELFGDDDAAVDALIAQNADALRRYAADHVSIGAGSEIWAMTPAGVSRVEGAEYVEIAFEVAHPTPIPEILTVTLDPFFDEIEDRDALLLIANDWERGIVENEADSLQRFTPGQRTSDVEFGESSQLKNLVASMELGVDHIRTGPDHMLFVIALLLPSVLLWRQRWLPVDGFVQSLWRITKVMTMFTLAHSVTFTLTGLGIVPSPGAKVTETIIALSIAATALHNLRPVLVNREWLIALIFGLFHGFGFASLVQGLEVDRTTELVSLLGRNIGIELGQIAVVLLCFPALFLLRVTRWYQPFLKVSSIGLVIISLGWAIERLFGGRAITSQVIDRITRLPDALIYLGVATAVCAAAYLSERSKGQLLPTAAEVDPADALVEADERDLTTV